ncbi:MAG TPA: protein lacX [Ruminococcaceae bacterium]|nr:protein lacX [Oscillospiraceae bacterium]
MITMIKNSTLKVSADSLGAELKTIESSDGVNYLWNGNPEYWMGRAPILFPFVGALRNGRAISAGGEITLPRHGFARSMDWTLENAEHDNMTFLLRSNQQTNQNYPYDFTLRVGYILIDNAVKTEFRVCNTGDAQMPYCVGGHPAFNIPLVHGESFEDYIVKFEELENADCPYVDLETGIILDERRTILKNQDQIRLHHDLFTQDALVFDNLKSRSVKLYSEKSGRGVQMDFHGMDYFAVWSPVKESPFVCLEPWTGTVTLESEDDIFEHKRGIRLLQPGEESIVSYTVTFF